MVVIDLLKGYVCMKVDKILLSDDKIYIEINFVSKFFFVIKIVWYICIRLM